MSDKIRLDPATLRWMADMLAASAAMEPRDAEERGAAKALGIIADGLRERADDEAASLPPRLSDWVKAAEGSKLGAPNLIGSWLFSWWLSSGHQAAFDALNADHKRVRVFNTRDGAEVRQVQVATPAALREALDALADAKGD